MDSDEIDVVTLSSMDMFLLFIFILFCCIAQDRKVLSRM